MATTTATAIKAPRKCGRIEVIQQSTGYGFTIAYCGRCGIIVESEVVGDVQRYRHGTARIAPDAR